MSVRVLASVALLLAVLLGAAGFLVARDLGLQQQWEEVHWTFENPTLQVRRGERAVVRPMVAGAPWERYVFTAVVGEPSAREEPLFPGPYVAAGVQELEPGDGVWRPSRNPIRYLALSQLGATSHREWLLEIEPVEERAFDGGDRRVLRLVFGHESGQTVAYYHDPEYRVPGLGWFRQERAIADREPEIYHARYADPIELARAPDGAGRSPEDDGDAPK